MKNEKTDQDASVLQLQLADREVILIGTAHISQDSVETVRCAIDTHQPDVVCVELDAQRYQSLMNPQGWQSLNIKEVIRKGQMPFLLANLALSSYQKRMGLQTGVKPGAELAEAARRAEELGIPVELIDRNIRTTLLRTWRKSGLLNKGKVLVALLASMFEKEEVSEEQLAELRQSDSLSQMLEEMGKLLPGVKNILVDERDTHMAHGIQQVQGKKILAVVGAAHLQGIKGKLPVPIAEETIDEITRIPPKPLVSKFIPWLIPALVVALFVGGFFFTDGQRLADAAIAWILANGLLSALGTLIACGHPLTILSAFVAAPLTSLNPTIGAGFVTALVQAFVAAPTVGDMEQVGEDLTHIKGWWHNRMARIMLVFFFSSLGSAIGTFVALGWLKNLFA